MKMATDTTPATPQTGEPLWTPDAEAALDGDFPIEGDAGSANGDGKAQITSGGTTPPPPAD